MIEHRWIWLCTAMACGVLLFTAPVTPWNALLPFNPDYLLYSVAMAAIGAQTLGVMGMRAHLRARRTPAPILVGIGFVSALAWGLATLATIWGASSGPGGIVVGILLMAPAGIVALALQIAALIGFARTERKAPL